LEGKLSNDDCGIKQFLSQLEARGWRLQQSFFALEATGVYGQGLVGVMHQAGLTVSVLNPAQVKYFALSVLRRTKNDTVDAQITARFCRERKPLATRPLRPIEEQLKLLVRERESRGVEQTRERNRAKKDPYQIELPKLIRRHVGKRSTRNAQRDSGREAVDDDGPATGKPVKNAGLCGIESAAFASYLCADAHASRRGLFIGFRPSPMQTRRRTDINPTEKII
jgi:transposase